MAASHNFGLWRYLKQVTLVLGIVVISVMTTLLVQHVTSPPRAMAQSSPQEVRASAFVLVGQDGTVTGRLAPGPAGNGRLTLFDAAGRERVVLAGAGFIQVNAPDGTTPRLLAGYGSIPGTNGGPPFDGVLLDADGRILNVLGASVQSPP